MISELNNQLKESAKFSRHFLLNTQGEGAELKGIGSVEVKQKNRGFHATGFLKNCNTVFR